MWDKLIKQMGVEREQLHSLLDAHHPLLMKCASTRPDPIELSALAAMLHSFYTGVENIFKRIALEVDGSLPHSETWHRQLLEIMTKRTSARAAVISFSLKEVLRGYLDFRHLFRHAYTFQLRWEKMAALVCGCRETLDQVEREINDFLASQSF